MAAAGITCVPASTTFQRPSVAQARPPQCLLAPRRIFQTQISQVQRRCPSETAGRQTRLCAAAVDTLEGYSSSLEDDPFMFEAESTQADALGDKALAMALAKLAWETKAESVKVLHVAKQSSICSYMVLATVFSRPQLTAVLGKIERSAAQDWDRKFTPTGGRSSWEMLDLGDVIVNVMSEDARLYYDLEGLYSNGAPVDLPFTRERPDVGPQGSIGGVQQWTTNLKQQ